MTTISRENNYLTLINVFVVEPQHQGTLLELLKQATATVRQVAGFISSSLHRSLDRTKVTMYAQWRSMEDYNAMRAHPEAASFLEQALKIASFHPGMYEVVETFQPEPRADN